MKANFQKINLLEFPNSDNFYPNSLIKKTKIMYK